MSIYKIPGTMAKSTNKYTIDIISILIIYLQIFLSLFFIEYINMGIENKLSSIPIQ